MKALIAGGGIGGVTAALCLIDAGIDVELYERKPGARRNRRRHSNQPERRESA